MEYLFTVKKAGWGIHITITVTSSIGAQPRSTATPLKDTIPVAVVFSGPGERMPEEMKREAFKGLRFVAEEIFESVDHKPVEIEISDITYPELDFQLEGVSVAICRWAEQEFNLRDHEIWSSFDRAENKYFFDWDPTKSAEKGQ